MIGRLLAAIARHLQDTVWLREMRVREVQAKRSALHTERRVRRMSWPEHEIYKPKNGDTP